MSNPSLQDLNIPVTGRLEDGTAILFRPLRRDDIDRLRAGFEQLSLESRYSRFFVYMKHLSDAQLQKLVDVDQRRHIAWTAVLREVPDEPGIGVAHAIRSETHLDEAEIAITVLDAYQGRGVGSALAWLMTRSAVAQGFRRFTADVRSDNRAMLALLQEIRAVHQVRELDDPIFQFVVMLPSTLEDFGRLPVPPILQQHSG